MRQTYQLCISNTKVNAESKGRGGGHIPSISKSNVENIITNKIHTVSLLETKP